MKKIIIFVLILFSFTSCKKEVVSEVKTEKADVVQLVYLPDTQRVDIIPTFSTNGPVSFLLIPSGSPAYYGVTFKCRGHGKTFTLEGKEIYNISKPGDSVTLEYVEVYLEDSNKNREFKEFRTTKVIK